MLKLKTHSVDSLDKERATPAGLEMRNPVEVRVEARVEARVIFFAKEVSGAIFFCHRVENSQKLQKVRTITTTVKMKTS